MVHFFKINVRDYQLVKYEYTMPVLIIVMLLILNEKTPFFNAIKIHEDEVTFEKSRNIC